MKKVTWVLFLLVSTINPGVLMAQNMLTNGAFDADINGWSNSFVTAEWISSDGAPISGNGSMKVTGVLNNNSLFGMNSDVFLVQSGYWYLTAGSLKTPAISVSERGVVIIEWYDSSDVMISQDSIDSGYGVDDDVWIGLDGYFQAPPLAVSAVVRLMLQTGFPGQKDQPFGLWDDAVVMQETIFTSDFD